MQASRTPGSPRGASPIGAASAAFGSFFSGQCERRFLRDGERHGLQQVARFLRVRAPRVDPGQAGPRWRERAVALLPAGLR
eukprot:8921125-Lingulodinium_polyedra.AAC.1